MLTTRQFDLDKLMSTQLNIDEENDEEPSEFSNLSNFYSSNGKGIKQIDEEK